MSCEWLCLQKGCRCRNCTQGPLKRDYDKSPVRECKAAGSASVPRESHPGLGDRVESALSKIGITQEAWVAWKQEHGLPPTCGCAARKEWLNRFGERFGKAAKAAASILYR